MPPTHARRTAGRSRITAGVVAVCACVLLLAGQPARCQPQAPAECTACNGSALLCGKRYNEVVFPATRHSVASRAEHWIAANQNHGITRQLNDGVRALMLEVHPLMGKLYLARGNPLVGRKPLADALVEVHAFMQSHQSEVITLLIQSHVPAAEIAAALDTAGLSQCLYAHQPGQPFPTLKEMVLSNRRLVIFADREGGAYPWYHPLWEYCQETSTKARRPGDFTSQLERGRPESPLCIVNHYLTAPWPSARLASQVNFNPLFQQRVESFVRESQRVPNFVVVDYYDVGALLEVVDMLNGLPWPQRHHTQPRADVQSVIFEENGASLRNEELISPDVPPNRPQ